MNDSDSEADPLAAAGRGVRRALPARRAPLAERVHREVPRAGRAHPAPVPGPGGDGAARLGRRAGRRELRRDRGGPGPGAAAARRIPHPPRGGPRRHGSRLRSGAGIPRPARGAQGASDGRADVPDPPRAIPPRGAGGGAAAPHQHRAGLRRRRARGRALLRHAVHPGSEPGSRPARAGAPPPPGPTAAGRRHRDAARS